MNLLVNSKGFPSREIFPDILLRRFEEMCVHVVCVCVCVCVCGGGGGGGGGGGI